MVVVDSDGRVFSGFTSQKKNIVCRIVNPNTANKQLSLEIHLNCVFFNISENFAHVMNDEFFNLYMIRMSESPENFLLNKTTLIARRVICLIISVVGGFGQHHNHKPFNVCI